MSNTQITIVPSIDTSSLCACMCLHVELSRPLHQVVGLLFSPDMVALTLVRFHGKLTVKGFVVSLRLPGTYDAKIDEPITK